MVRMDGTTVRPALSLRRNVIVDTALGVAFSSVIEGQRLNGNANRAFGRLNYLIARTKTPFWHHHKTLMRPLAERRQNGTTPQAATMAFIGRHET